MNQEDRVKLAEFGQKLQAVHDDVLDIKKYISGRLEDRLSSYSQRIRTTERNSGIMKTQLNDHLADHAFVRAQVTPPEDKPLKEVARENAGVLAIVVTALVLALEIIRELI